MSFFNALFSIFWMKSWLAFLLFVRQKLLLSKNRDGNSNYKQILIWIIVPSSNKRKKKGLLWKSIFLVWGCGSLSGEGCVTGDRGWTFWSPAFSAGTNWRVCVRLCVCAVRWQLSKQPRSLAAAAWTSHRDAFWQDVRLCEFVSVVCVSVRAHRCSGTTMALNRVSELCHEITRLWLQLKLMTGTSQCCCLHF